MKLMKREGQAALEYLITYGWAILGILIVGVVLWQFGAFSPPAPPPGCSGFSQIKPLDWKAGGNQFIMTIINEAGLKLNITNINVNITDANCGFDGTDIEIRPGESHQSTITCSGLSAEYASGEYYRAHITIDYLNPQSMIPHKSAGECWGVVE
jgi:hypothetical protein